MVSLTGLSQAFGNTSNPQYLMPFHSHAAAIRLLSEVRKDSNNIRVLIGEPGVGKTTLLLHLLQQFRASARIAHLFWTQLGRGEFLAYFLHSLGVPHPAVNIGEAQKQLSTVLEREFRQGRMVIVAIDEAHNLEVAALCGLAELLDSKSARSKDLQVVLAGLPHLTAKLSARELRRLSERISEITSLSRLTVDETAAYIRRRLEVSGYQGAFPFTSDAIATIATLSEGIPRNINNICSAGLFLATKRSGSAIDSSTVIEADAHWGGRPIVPEAAQQLAASLADSVPALATDQETPRIPEWHIAHTSPPAPVPLIENPADSPAKAPVGEPESQPVADRIQRWFGNRLAWSGTLGELAAAVGEQETEVARSLHASFETLRSFGIAASLRETVGRTRSVLLRRLEEPRPTAEAFDSRQEAELTPVPSVGAAKDRSRDAQEGNRPEEMPDQNPQQDEAVSPADHLLGLVRANELREADAHASRFRRIFSALLMLLSVTVVSIGWTYSGRLVRQKDHLLGLAQQFTKTRPAGATQPGPIADEEAFGASNGISVESRNAQPAVDMAENTTGFEQAALSGDPNAQYELGRDYALGRGVPPDPVNAYIWLTLSFANGKQDAEASLRELTRKMSQADIARIRRNLGEMYATGTGVHSDKVTAYMWHLLAESAGEDQNRSAISELAANMSEDQKSQARTRASQWLRRHQQ